MPFVKHNNSRIYYEVHGSGQPLVFVHPPVMGHLTFRSQQPLSEHYQLIYIDLFNSGKSSHHVSENEVEVAYLAETIEAVLTKLTIQSAIICGYSNGCSVAIEFALTYSHKTDGLILLSGFPEVSTFFLDREFQVGIWAAKKEWMSLFAYVLTKNHFRSKREQDEMARWIKRADPHSLKEMYEAGKRYAATERLKQLTMPILVIYGKRDLFSAPYMIHFLQEIKEIEVVLVSKVAHQVPTRTPNECNTIIHQWIKRHIGKRLRHN
ncbi:alpha/beta fold hydrolase [Bacillus sp. JCM 19034]|uniref:alpha/beta fold hydrolase n=1 Tax=Bacillus sp. JCM 19034 TaxID=1481928 RepID=UPI000783ACE4|nr:alpha/beta hydrolase [Bacillus sp. JCM 19034]